MSDWRELLYEAERDEPHNGEDFYTAIRRYFDLAALSQQLAACNQPQDSDADRTPPPNQSEAVGDDSSVEPNDDRPIITWHDSGDEHP